MNIYLYIIFALAFHEKNIIAHSKSFGFGSNLPVGMFVTFILF